MEKPPMNFQQHPNEASLISSERAVHDFKGIVHQRIQHLSGYTHPHVVETIHDFLPYTFLPYNESK